MGLTKGRGSQLKLGTLALALMQADFLEGTDWDLTNGAGNATIKGLRAPTAAGEVATKDYVDGIVDTTLKAPDVHDASGGSFPTDYKGSGSVDEGDAFYISVAGTLGSGTIVNVGDMIVANTDNPGQTDANWYVLESNRDQATESILGVAKIATQAIVDAGTNDTDYITSLKLATYLTNNGYVDYTIGSGLYLIDEHEITLGSTLSQNAIFNDDGNGRSVTWGSPVAISDFNVNAINGISFNSTNGGSDEASITLDTSLSGSPNLSISVYNDNGDGGDMSISSAGPSFTYENGTSGNVTTLGVKENSVLIETDTDVRSFAGLQYELDYSVNFTNLSLVHKGYVDSLNKLTRHSNELPTVTGGSAVLPALANLGSHATDKVTNVEVFLNGFAQAPGAGNDYTLNALTGVITFTFNLAADDTVLVHYDAQDA